MRETSIQRGIGPGIALDVGDRPGVGQGMLDRLAVSVAGALDAERRAGGRLGMGERAVGAAFGRPGVLGIDAAEIVPDEEGERFVGRQARPRLGQRLPLGRGAKPGGHAVGDLAGENGEDAFAGGHAPDFTTTLPPATPLASAGPPHSLLQEVAVDDEQRRPVLRARAVRAPPSETT